MSATYQTRIQRLRRLEAILPRATTVPGECLDISHLLDILGDAYGQGAATSRRRALQRDLDELVKEARIEVVNAGGKTRHYRRLAGDPQEDALIWQYTLQQVRDLIAEALPLRRCAAIPPPCCGSVHSRMTRSSMKNPRAPPSPYASAPGCRPPASCCAGCWASVPISRCWPPPSCVRCWRARSPRWAPSIPGRPARHRPAWIGLATLGPER